MGNEVVGTDVVKVDVVEDNYFKREKIDLSFGEAAVVGQSLSRYRRMGREGQYLYDRCRAVAGHLECVLTLSTEV